MTSPNRPPRILITNIVTLNTGDAAILQGMLQILRERYGPDADIVVYDRAAKTAAKYYPWATFRQAPLIKEKSSPFDRWLSHIGYGHWIPRLRYLQLRTVMWLVCRRLEFLVPIFASLTELETIKDYLGADLVVSTGGTYLVENYDLAPAIYDYRLTLAAGRPLVFFTQSLGPFAKEKNRKEFSRIFSKAVAIFLRDERSMRHVIELDVDPAKITLARDAAFMLAEAEKQPDARSAGTPCEGPHVAISVRSLKFFGDAAREQQFQEDLRSLICHLVSKCGAQVTFLSTCQGIDEYWTDDSAVAERIADGLPASIKQSVRIDRRFRQPVEIVRAYADFEAVIATRMHAAILALVSGTPVFAIAYEFKIVELFRHLRLEHCVAPVGASAAELVEKVTAAIEGRNQMRESLRDLRLRMKEEARLVLGVLPNVG